MGVIEPRRGKCIIIAIDYFTRKGFAEWIKDKTAKTVKEFVQRLQNKMKIGTIILDGAKGNISKPVEDLLRKEIIKLHVTTPYHHK